MTISNPIKALIGLAVAFGAAIGGAKFAFESTSAADVQAAADPWAQDKMEFIAWNGQPWTGWIRDGNFELVPENEGTWHRHSNTTIAYIGWDAEQWQARVDGDQFVIAHRGEWHGHTEAVEALRYRDWGGVNSVRTVAQLTR